MKQHTLSLALISILALSTAASASNVIEGSDRNSADNPLVQPVDDALSGGGIDQSMQFGDLLVGKANDDVLLGRLGTDLLLGKGGSDVIVGGTEHFNPFNRDRAFGGPGWDTFLWKPGDGSDLFFGGSEADAIAFGQVGEIVDGHTVFETFDDQLAGEVFINPVTGLPEIDITNSPGFCEIIDGSDPYDAAELDALGLDHLVRFVLRDVREDFDNGVQDTDNGVRVTLHLKDVEFVVCASKAGGEIEFTDLTTTPPTLVNPYQIDAGLRAKLEKMVF